MTNDTIDQPVVELPTIDQPVVELPTIEYTEETLIALPGPALPPIPDHALAPVPLTTVQLAQKLL